MRPVVGSVSVRLRRPEGGESERRAWPSVRVDVFEPSVPWRTFRWVHGQKHYSGTYWSATMRAHVVYESRLELTRLLYGDFDPAVTAIYAQPFLLSAEVDGGCRSHVPDFLMVRDGDVPLVVDVKPRHLLTAPKVAFSLSWAREVVESRGWEFQVWTEPPEAELANLRFLAGYRRDWLFDPELLAEVREMGLVGARLGEAFRAFPGREPELVRSAVLHLLWGRHLVTDLDTPLSARHELRSGPVRVVGSGTRELPVPVDSANVEDEKSAAGAMGRPVARAGRGGRMSGAGVRVGVGTRFWYDGEVVTVEGMFGHSAGNEVLVRDGVGRMFRLSLREVLFSGRARVIATGPGPTSDDPGDTASTVLARLSEEELGEVRERAAHLNELLCGYRSGSAELAAPGESRPQYAPGLPKMRRYQSKAEELGVSLSTVLRWVAAFHAEREAGLARRRPEGPVGLGGVGRADPRWVEMALEVMSEYGDESTPGKATVLRAIGPRLAARYPGHEIKLPKRSTAYGYLEELESRVPTFRLSAKRNRDIAARPAAAYGRLRPTRPGEYVLLDTTRLDVFALDPLTLRWVQAELTVAMDWYTRCIVGLRLTPWSTKSIDVAASLFQLYRPRPAGKDWPAHAVWPDHGIPRGVLLDRDAIEGPMADAAKGLQVQGCGGPALVPETIVVDHGKVYVSEHITSVCQRLGVSIQPARLRTGRDKGPVERFFRSLRQGLLEHLPGYKGPDVHGRGLNPEKEAFFFLSELEAIIREWTAAVYHHRPHRGLVDPRVPGCELSPAMMFDHGIARSGYIEVPGDPDLAYEFLKTEWVPVHHYGIEIGGGNRRYNGDALNDYRNKTSPYTGPRAKGGWPVQRNPDDINYVYFRDPQTRSWHPLEWEHAPALDFPLSEEAFELSRTLARKKYRYPDTETAIAELLERWHLGLGLTRAERRMALRLAREQSAFDLPTAPQQLADQEEETAALPSVVRVLAAQDDGPGGDGDTDEEPEPYEGEAPGDDDDQDELDGPDAVEDFFADALDDA
ncbi:TnsA-like heteromeric transposase endonuclease subunit [Streptomyces scopuliridis]|uniref:TnsA-like heteromeric transposase endonuclease subunit n=1 Tax=Streptomyces scopuliridis TaxID=452529 RepID=UPI0035DEF39C